VQVGHLLDAIRNPVHKTCLAVIYACGPRISEATTLEVGSVDRANQVLRIIGKGDKQRLAPLPQPVLNDLGLAIRALARLVRGKFRALLLRKHPDLIIPDVVWRTRWVPHVTAWRAGEQAVLDYLARYVWRIMAHFQPKLALVP
jgi:site-specific recombinase XerD